jgi:hypothetical protein
MKAIKTVATILGILLAAAVVIPLAVLAGLFVWLKVTEESDEEALDSAGRRIAPSPSTRSRPRRPATRAVRARPRRADAV